MGIKWNNNWHVRNCHSYVVTATKIRFQFQFPRPPDAPFGGEWLLNCEFKFGCRRISNIANHVKCNYFWDDDGVENVTLWLGKTFKFLLKTHCWRRGCWYHVPHSSSMLDLQVLKFCISFDQITFRWSWNYEKSLIQFLVLCLFGVLLLLLLFLFFEGDCI